MAGLNDAMGALSVNSSEDADSLLAKAQAEIANDNGFLAQQAPTGAPTAREAQSVAPSQTDDILSRLNNL